MALSLLGEGEADIDDDLLIQKRVSSLEADPSLVITADAECEKEIINFKCLIDLDYHPEKGEH